MLSFSTCWNSGRHTDGAAMLGEIVDMGFRHIELGHGTRISLMEGIKRFFRRGNIRITSLHNFCPLPVEVLAASPNCYQYTSHQKAERERALKLTLRTIDFAEKLGASLWSSISAGSRWAITRINSSLWLRAANISAGNMSDSSSPPSASGRRWHRSMWAAPAMPC